VVAQEWASAFDEFNTDNTINGASPTGTAMAQIENGAAMDNGANAATEGAQGQGFQYARGADATAGTQLDSQLGLDMQQGFGAINQDLYGANRSDFMAASNNGAAIDQQQMTAGGMPGQAGGAALGAGPDTQQPRGALAQAAGEAPTNPASPLDVMAGRSAPQMGGMSYGNSGLGPFADLPGMSQNNPVTGAPPEMSPVARSTASSAQPQQRQPARGYAGGAGAGVNTQLPQRPFAPSQQRKGGFDMNAALKAMTALAASRKQKEEERRLIEGASARQWQHGYPGAPGTPAGIAGAQQQGVLAQAALGGQTFSPVRPIMPSPYRRPAIA
jgi:hypothetical protein